MRKLQILFLNFITLILCENLCFSQVETFAGNIHFDKGTLAPNAVWFEHDGKTIAFHSSGSTSTDVLFLCEAIRNTSSSIVKSGAKRVFIGEKEKAALTDPGGDFWDKFIQRGRFNEENCITLDRPFEPVDISETKIITIADNEIAEVGPVKIRAIFTPGIRRGAVSYSMELDGNKIVICGDLIRSGGKLGNLYDLQDVFPEGQIGGYHGFMARAPQLIASLKKIRTLEPDLIFPMYGPVIVNPQADIDALIEKLRNTYRNYLSTCALWWYFGNDRMNATAKAILGNDYDIERMETADVYDNPDWLNEFATTRLIRSATGETFVLDVGSPDAGREILKRFDSNQIGPIKGIFVTHYHHDHNSGVGVVLERFPVPIHAVGSLCDILERPGAYRMPCIENIALKINRLKDGTSMKWNEFEFTFYDYPGQTYYHNALLVKKENERPVLFVGDSFAPNGIDDYCLWNRNFIRENMGYLQCIKLIRSIKPAPLIVNQHVVKPFDLDESRLDYIEKKLRDRVGILSDLLDLPEINFGLDHAWTRFDPFVADIRQGESLELKWTVMNHFEHKQTFRIELDFGNDFPYVIPDKLANEMSVDAGRESSISWKFEPIPQLKRISSTFISGKVYTIDGKLTGLCEAILHPAR